MPSAATFLLAGLAGAIVLCFAAWMLYRRPQVRSPLRSVDEFNESMRALAPEKSGPGPTWR
ncbi:MAG TPA: hypothetical protein VM600_01805 [Actinomycetota bacterium]|nr:hypothetical protein [Actinomycetota bacterium]